MNKQLALDLKLRDDATFSNYLGGAATKVLQADAWTYLWGKPGSGKTHLLQAICHHTEGAIYLSGLKQHSKDVFEGLECMQVVCIDDIHEVLDDADWQEALFHLMNAIKDMDKRLYISGNKPVRGLRVGLADLKSRLLAAAVVETDVLDDEQKLAVLVQRAENRGFRMGEDVARFILSRTSRDMRKLIDVLQHLELETLQQGKRITIPFVKRILNI
ncbi:MAG: DnaA regulatory inactivator Hda [Pseudomonadales bacterium]|nr:DnaA regulatory inactivator Hda [Pseudomonadales bacterium]